jgi:catalase
MDGLAYAHEALAAMDTVYGPQEPPYRRVHARGVVCSGTFEPTAAAGGLTRAPHMQGGPVPVTVRFSNGSGNPKMADFMPDGRGMAVKFYLPDGSRTDIVGLNLPCFFVRTPDDFIKFTRSGKPFLFGQPGPRFFAYMATHPEAWKATRAFAMSRPPVSFATVRYNNLHALRWIAADGTERAIRYSFIPEAGEHALSLGKARKEGRDYLAQELRERLDREPARFTLQVQIAGPDDKTADPTSVWPDERERVDVGTLEVTGLDDSREKDGDVLVFDPTRVCDGIELSDDPLPLLRSQTYSLSVERRTGIARPPGLG